jgi:hypothetical protein
MDVGTVLDAGPHSHPSGSEHIHTGAGEIPVRPRKPGMAQAQIFQGVKIDDDQPLLE